MRIVVKVGTSSLAHSSGRINVKAINTLVKVLSDIKNSGTEVIFVSSGAAGVGRGRLQMAEKPADLATQQATASIGQSRLMHIYDDEFSKFGHHTSQILITIADIDESYHKQNFVNMLNRLLELGVLPIINENNAIGTDDILIGDNDRIAAIVASAVEADLLVLLTDVDGLYDSNPNTNPNAKMLEVIEEITPALYEMVDGKSSLGTGGMGTKIDAAKIAADGGCDTIIANAKDPAILYDILNGTARCTHFKA